MLMLGVGTSKKSGTWNMIKMSAHWPFEDETFLLILWDLKCSMRDWRVVSAVSVQQVPVWFSAVRRWQFWVFQSSVSVQLAKRLQWPRSESAQSIRCLSHRWLFRISQLCCVKVGKTSIHYVLLLNGLCEIQVLLLPNIPQMNGKKSELRKHALCQKNECFAI